MSGVQQENTSWIDGINDIVSNQAALSIKQVKETKKKQFPPVMFADVVSAFRRNCMPNAIELFSEVCEFNWSTVSITTSKDGSVGTSIVTTLGSEFEGISVRQWLLLLSQRISEVPKNDLLMLEAVLNSYFLQWESVRNEIHGFC